VIPFRSMLNTCSGIILKVFDIIPESAFDFDRNRCSICSGMKVRDGLDSYRVKKTEEEKGFSGKERIGLMEFIMSESIHQKESRIECHTRAMTLANHVGDCG
jgi:hypothetical protein